MVCPKFYFSYTAVVLQIDRYFDSHASPNLESLAIARVGFVSFGRGGNSWPEFLNVFGSALASATTDLFYCKRRFYWLIMYCSI